MCYYFDQQKELIATKSPLTYFIPKPAMEVWNRAKERYGEIVAQDGVHPNDEGYKVFAGLFSEIDAFFSTSMTPCSLRCGLELRPCAAPRLPQSA